MTGADGYPEIPEDSFSALVALWRFCDCIGPNHEPWKRVGDGVMFWCGICEQETFVWWKEVIPDAEEKSEADPFATPTAEAPGACSSALVRPLVE